MSTLSIKRPDETPAEQGTPAHLPAEVLVKRRKRVRGGGETWEVVRARGHLDEVQELRTSAPQSAPSAPSRPHAPVLARCCTLQVAYVDDAQELRMSDPQSPVYYSTCDVHG